jgi:thioredoxin reductase
MVDLVYDLAVVGGGPSGLMCGLTGVTGIPINPPRNFKGIVVDANEIASFARYGKLRITHRWSYNGGKLLRYLEDEAATSNLVVRPHTRVVSVELEADVKRLVTSTGEILARQVALCVGFFPYGFLAKQPDRIRISFSPPSIEAPHLPKAAGSSVVVLGRGEPTVQFANALRELRPDLEFQLLLDGPESVSHDGQPIPVRHGLPQSFDVNSNGVEITIALGDTQHIQHGDFLLVDYDAYTLSTQVTDFLEGTGVTRRGGYIVTDRSGHTGVSGVVAAGNIVTPVSGVLTALDTGFHAGLTVYDRLHREKFGEPALVFPWLPRGGLDAHPLASMSPLSKP